MQNCSYFYINLIDVFKFFLGIRLPPESPSSYCLSPALGVYFTVLWKLWNTWTLKVRIAIHQEYSQSDLFTVDLEYFIFFTSIFSVVALVAPKTWSTEESPSYCTPVTAATSHRQLHTLGSDILSQPECHKLHTWTAQGPLAKSATELKWNSWIPIQLPCFCESKSQYTVLEWFHFSLIWNTWEALLLSTNPSFYLVPTQATDFDVKVSKLEFLLTWKSKHLKFQSFCLLFCSDISPLML